MRNLKDATGSGMGNISSCMLEHQLLHVDAAKLLQQVHLRKHHSHGLQEEDEKDGQLKQRTAFNEQPSLSAKPQGHPSGYC